MHRPLPSALPTPARSCAPPVPWTWPTLLNEQDQALEVYLPRKHHLPPRNHLPAGIRELRSLVECTSMAEKVIFVVSVFRFFLCKL
jgi:hypothetical protein